MRVKDTYWYSPRLEMNMPIVAYGHFGMPVLMFPTASADYKEYERFHLIDFLGDLINSGKIKVYSINSINRHAWGNSRLYAHDRARNHQLYDEYIAREVVPFIFNDCGGAQPIITTGASMGALYGANVLFKYPEFFAGTVGMHGVYSIKPYAGDSFDSECYFCSPVEYMSNLNDNYYLPQLRAKGHIHLLTSTGMWENPQHTYDMSDALARSGIPHNLDVWGSDIPHDWPAWYRMLPYYLEKITYYM